MGYFAGGTPVTEARRTGSRVPVTTHDGLTGRVDANRLEPTEANTAGPDRPASGPAHSPGPTPVTITPSWFRIRPV